MTAYRILMIHQFRTQNVISADGHTIKRHDDVKGPQLFPLITAISTGSPRNITAYTNGRINNIASLSRGGPGIS